MYTTYFILIAAVSLLGCAISKHDKILAIMVAMAGLLLVARFFGLV